MERGPPVRGTDSLDPEGPGTGPGADRPAIADGTGWKRTPMIATVLALLLAAPTVAAAGPPPSDLEAAHVAAEAAVRSGDYRAAVRRYRDVLADLERRPATDAPEAEWTRALLQLAAVESVLGNGDSARAAMERVLAIDPAARLDPELYSPSFGRDFDAARSRVAARPRFRLRVTTRKGTGQAYVQGRSLGAVPAETRLPAGSYRVGVEAGGSVQTITLELVRDETVTLDVDAPAVVPDLAAKAPPAPPATDPSPPTDWMRPTAWVATGLAVAAAGVATWQGVAAAGSYSDAKGMLLPDGTLKPGVDPAAYASASSSFQSERRNAWIAGGSAVILGVGATVLWLLAPTSPVEAAPGGLAIHF